MTYPAIPSQYSAVECSLELLSQLGYLRRCIRYEQTCTTLQRRVSGRSMLTVGELSYFFGRGERYGETCCAVRQ